MNIKTNVFMAAIFAAACVLNADAQKTRHVVPNRGLYPERGMSSGLGGGSVGLQKAVVAPPAATPKTITITGTYREVKPPTPEEIAAKEKAAAAKKVADSLKTPIGVKFTPEQFEEHAVELVRDMYVTDSPGGNLSIGYDLSQVDGEIVKTRRASLVDGVAPKDEEILKAFEKGESFIVLRKVPGEVACGLCDGIGMVKTGEITFKEKPAESRFAVCTRCKGSKKSSLEVDMVYKVVLKE